MRLGRERKAVAIFRMHEADEMTKAWAMTVTRMMRSLVREIWREKGHSIRRESDGVLASTLARVSRPAKRSARSYHPQLSGMRKC